MSAQRGYILLSECIQMEGDGIYTASCDELGLATYSNSQESASDRLRKSIVKVLKESTKRGEIQELLKARGIRVYPSSAQGLPVAIMNSTTFRPSDDSLRTTAECTHRAYEFEFAGS